MSYADHRAARGRWNLACCYLIAAAALLGVVVLESNIVRMVVICISAALIGAFTPQNALSMPSTAMGSVTLPMFLISGVLLFTAISACLITRAVPTNIATLDSQ